MPFVVCSTCPKAIWVNEKDIEAAKAAHTENHKKTTGEPMYTVFDSEKEVTPTWMIEVATALDTGKWFPKTKEG